jgi:predicted GTPase
LVLGKTGCGKSSLINNVFGVERAHVSHGGPGKANINVGFRPNDNDRFILHDSEGFEPGEDAKFKTVMDFIDERSKKPDLGERLHAIWICISIPVAGDRVAEIGVEQIIKMVHGRVPLIIVFTKYDMLVTRIIFRAARSGSDEQVWENAEREANSVFDKLCVVPIHEVLNKEVPNANLSVPIKKVSGQPRYASTIKELIRATDQKILQQTNVSSHTEPHSLNFATAQRANADLKVEASIDVGRLKYWSGLLSSTDFTGKKLRQCLEVIHRDIVSVWNIRNSSYLESDVFKARMTVLVDDLLSNPNTPTPSDGLTLATVATLAGAASNPAGIVILSLGSTVWVAKWLIDVYQNSSHNIACVMAYIVDLTIIMHRLSAIEISEERVVSTLKIYASSGEIAQVHNDIRAFSSRIHGPRLSDKDDTFDEIIRLIEQHRVQVPRT